MKVACLIIPKTTEVFGNGVPHWYKICVLSFCITFTWYTSCFDKYLAINARDACRNLLRFTYVPYSCPILTKIGMCLHILIKLP
jgi:hypothetical protein